MSMSMNISVLIPHILTKRHPVTPLLANSVYTSIVALAFAMTSLLLVVYDRLVTRRQERTKNAALKVVASMFPSSVQDKVLEGAYEGGKDNQPTNVIASFFPETTVMFADISGFTAWASTREPAQVFQLLETIYGAFDEIARRCGIFKVETVGDCYVAVAGVPQPRKDHAVAMLRFARECQARMVSLSQQLEATLGPDTADLAFRIGIHSGAVTGGVLRGQNSRFQLFGDTMNMAAVSVLDCTGSAH
jgi:class 3 adenylate cyclase